MVGTAVLVAGMFCAAPAISQPDAGSSLSTDRGANLPAPTRVDAYDGHQRLKNDPHIGGHDNIVLQAYGFSPSEAVAVRRLDDPSFQRALRADAEGIVTYRFRVGRVKMEDDVVTFEGLGSAPSGNGGGNVQAFVPHFSIFPFRAVR